MSIQVRTFAQAVAIATAYARQHSKIESIPGGYVVIWQE